VVPAMAGVATNQIMASAIPLIRFANSLIVWDILVFLVQRFSVLTLFAVPISISKELNVLHVCFAGNWIAGCFQTSHAELNSIRRQNLRRVALNVGDKRRDAKHTIWYRRFKFRVRGKHNGRMNGVRRQKIEKSPYRNHVAVVLAYWILESELASKEHLCPISVTRIAEDPASVIFRLNYEHPKAWYQDMIDLRGAIR
jgi:hypothetical protein